METPIETSLKLVLWQLSKKAEESCAILSKLPLHELFLMYRRPGNLSQTFIYSAVAFELSVVPNKKTKNKLFFSAKLCVPFSVGKWRGFYTNSSVLSLSDTGMVSIFSGRKHSGCIQYSLPVLNTLVALRCLAFFKLGKKLK